VSIESVNSNNRDYAESLSLIEVAVMLAIAFLCNSFEVLIAACWFGIFLITVWAYLKGNTSVVWYCIAASPAMEVWGRMSRAPMVPDEMGKYYLVLAIGVILLHNLKHATHYPVHHAGKVLLLILLPSLVVHLATFNYDYWVFNGLGIIELTLLLLLSSVERWDVEKFCKALQYAMYPLFGILVFITLKTPTYENVEFQLNANSTAGFGSNQVATILGLGILLSAALIVLKRPLIAFKPLNYAMIGYLLFRGLMTFSRGGMVVAAICIIIMMLPNMFASFRSFVRFAALSLALFSLGYVVFDKVNDISGNNLMLRYQGETSGTLDRTKRKNINTITSGRANIITSDWLIFKDNPIFGVGIGRSPAERRKYGFEATVAHTEFSRLMSEQGLWGACTVIGLFTFAFTWVFRQRLSAWKGVTAALFTIAILTTFHAAMRTNTSAVFYALAAIPVYYHTRKQVDEPEAD
jgi:hypothetical protein